MAKLTPDVALQVVKTCQTNAGEIAGALGRTFGGKFDVPTDGITAETLATGENDFRGSGLVCLFTLDGSAAVAFLPQSSRLLPDWYAAPDASGANKLFTLALEWGMLLLPEEFMPLDNKAQRVGSFQDVLQRGEVPPNAGVVSITVSAGGPAAKIWVIWPVDNAEKVLVPELNKVVDESVTTQSELKSPIESNTFESSGDAAKPSARTSYEGLDDGLRLLPSFTRSLLKIKVPVVVTLAASKRAVRQILEIVPGSILQFDKSCEDPLTIEVGNQPIAQGECVKVGDMFGLRITSIVMPEERFFALRGKADVSNGHASAPHV